MLLRKGLLGLGVLERYTMVAEKNRL